ncbi:hypothetical protein HZC09_04745 [Candidatus Micrarchaeota archaeon]|nr:hypothetical protein [Candidatus Micrarchaeota archaeon]
MDFGKRCVKELVKTAPQTAGASFGMTTGGIPGAVVFGAGGKIIGEEVSRSLFPRSGWHGESQRHRIAAYKGRLKCRR